MQTKIRQQRNSEKTKRRRNGETNRNRTSRKNQRIDEDCFVSSVVITVKKRQIGKNSTKLAETKQLHQNETTHAEHGGITKPDSG